MKRQLIPRFLIIALVMLAMMGALIFQLGVLTLGEGESLAQQASEESTASIAVKGTRGSIMDRNGIVLAYSENCYNVEFLRDGNKRTDYDSAIYTEALIKAIDIIEKGGGTIINTSYIQEDENGSLYYDWGVTSEAAIRARYKNFCDAMGFRIADEDDMGTWKKAQDAYLDLRSAWYIPEEMPFEDAVKIISIRQEVNLNNYKAYEPITIAYDVSMEVVAEIETMKDELPGLQTAQSTTRIYPYGETASHIVGYMQRTVTEEMLEKGYTYSDYIGVAGVERTMEEFLTAATTEHQGSKTLEVNKNKAIIRELSSTPATDGDDVMLTIDLPFQRVAEQALDDLIKELAEYERGLIETNEDDKYSSYDDIKTAETGAIVVLDVNSGEVLALASNPRFDPNWFIKGLTNEQNEYLFGESSENTTPLRNKAVSAKLAPGSIFKMVTGLAGLMEGELSLTETISDMGKYILYDENGEPIERNAPSCHTDYPSTHADQDLVKALTNSCNYYFFEVANRLGIERLNRWAERLGLTSLTGVELTGETTGIVGGQDVLFDNSLIRADGEAMTLGDQKTSLPSYVYRVLKDRLYGYLALSGKAADDEDVTRCALLLMQLQDGKLEGKGADARRIIAETIGIPEGITRVQPWIEEIMSILNEIQWKATQTIRAGIGQGVSLVTPVAVARYVAAIANGGTVYDVHIVDKVIDSSGVIVNEIEPSVYDKIDAPSDYWNAIREGLKGVVSPEDGGTASKKFSEEFQEKGYLARISGKTGTAQVGNDTIDIENTSWFVTYAPRDNADIAIVVCVPSGYSGSSSAPAIEDIITYYFDKMAAAAPENLPELNSPLP